MKTYQSKSNAATGICPECGALRALTFDGVLRSHRLGQSLDTCAGSWKLPKLELELRAHDAE